MSPGGLQLVWLRRVTIERRFTSTAWSKETSDLIHGSDSDAADGRLLAPFGVALLATGW